MRKHNDDDSIFEFQPEDWGYGEDDLEYQYNVIEAIVSIVAQLTEELGLDDASEIPPDLLRSYIEYMIGGDEYYPAYNQLRERFMASRNLLQSEEVDPRLMNMLEQCSKDIKSKITSVVDDRVVVGASMVFDFTQKSTKGYDTLYLPCPDSVEYQGKKCSFMVGYSYLDRVDKTQLKKDSKYIECKDSDQCIIVSDGVMKTIEHLKNEVSKIVSSDNINVKLPEKSEPEIQETIEINPSETDLDDGYYEDRDIYVYNHKIYHEEDVIWISVQSARSMFGSPTYINVNEDTYISEDIAVAVDTDVCKNIKVNDKGERVPSTGETKDFGYISYAEECFTTFTPSEAAYLLAKEYADTQDTVGVALVCIDGYFYVPCTIKYNPKSQS